MTGRLSTSDVDERDSFAYWRDAICRHIVELKASAFGRTDAAPFRGEIFRNPVDWLQVDTVIADAHDVARTPRLISRAGTDDLFLTVLVRGEGVFEQDDRQAVLAHPGDFVLVDSARPYRGRLRGRSRQVVVRVPRDQLAEWMPRFDRVTAVTVSGTGGVGALASGLLRALPRYGEHPGPAPEVTGTVLDLVTAALQQRADTDAERRSVRAAHLTRARSFLRRHLSDPGLTPAAVARGIDVSERYLYALFESEGTTSPGRWILDERLARAHVLLADSRWMGRTIAEIARSVGFMQPGHFARTFKARYGINPRERRAGA